MITEEQIEIDRKANTTIPCPECGDQFWHNGACLECGYDLNLILRYLP